MGAVVSLSWTGDAGHNANDAEAHFYGNALRVYHGGDGSEIVLATSPVPSSRPVTSRGVREQRAVCMR